LHSTSQFKQRRKASDAAMATSTHCTETTNCTDIDDSMPLSLSVGTCRDNPPDTCVSFDLDTCNPTVDASQSTHATGVDTAIAVTARDKPHPAVTKRPVRLRRRPARFLETIQARRLVNRNLAARARCRAACCDVTPADSCQSSCCVRVVRTHSVVNVLPKKSGCIRSVHSMPRSSIFRSERFASSFEAESGPGMALDRSFSHRSIEGHQGFSQPVVDRRVGVGLDRAGAASQVVDRSVDAREPTAWPRRLSFRPSAAQTVWMVAYFGRDHPTPSI